MPLEDHMSTASTAVGTTTATWAPTPHRLRTSDGIGSGQDADWKVVVPPGESGTIRREISMNGSPWVPNQRDWCPELTIWPTWSPEMVRDAASDTPLQGVHDYWSAADDRLRDSAKWMAAVIGAGLAAVVGASPLAGMRENPPTWMAVMMGVFGVVVLMGTLLLVLLVLRVMRPQSVSYNDVQTSDQASGRWNSHQSLPLRRWKDTVESQQDLYLPCGVKCLVSLRQSMIIEEITLIALAHAVVKTTEEAEINKIRSTQEARAARLKELRDAAARVATIGEFYRVRYNSTFATYAGVTLAVLGTLAIVGFFTWPTV
ncbi:hypothetical protein ACFY36_19425 [Actinoplanes sp. NPDC000266]